MDKFKKPAVAGAVFFALVRAYSIATQSEARMETQLMVASLVAGTTFATGFADFDEPATKSLTAGSLFAGAMYLGLGNENHVLNATLGTISTYASEVLVPETKKKQQTEDDGPFSMFASAPLNDEVKEEEQHLNQ